MRHWLRRNGYFRRAFIFVGDERSVGKAKLHDITTRILFERRHCHKSADRLRRQFLGLNGNFLGLRKAAGCILHLDDGKNIRYGHRRAIHNRTADRNRLAIDFVPERVERQRLCAVGGRGYHHEQIFVTHREDLGGESRCHRQDDQDNQRGGCANADRPGIAPLLNGKSQVEMGAVILG